MNKLKKITISIVTIAMLSTSAHSGWVGSSTLAEQLVQIKKLIDQIDIMKDQLSASTKVRDIISFKKEMKTLITYMDKYSIDMMNLEGDIINSPRSQVGLYAKQLFNKYNVFDDCNYKYLNNLQKKNCKSKMIRNVQEIATYQKTTESLQAISSNLEDLSEKRLKSKDLKQSADIANAIQMEIAKIQVIKTQVDLMESQNRSRERVERRQAEQIKQSKVGKVPSIY